MRPWVERIYGIPPEQVVGSSGVTKFQTGPDGKPVLMKELKVEFVDDGPGQARSESTGSSAGARTRLRQLRREARQGAGRSDRRRHRGDGGGLGRSGRPSVSTISTDQPLHGLASFVPGQCSLMLDRARHHRLLAQLKSDAIPDPYVSVNQK